MVSVYREERARQEALKEEFTLNYSSEIKQYEENNGPLITFKEWLIHNRRIK